MDVNYINSFIMGTEEIFKQMAGNIKLTRQKPLMKDSQFTGESIVCIVGFNGEVEGQVVFSFTKDFALRLTSEMCGMEIADIDDLALSALGEISNMVSGNALIKLNELTAKKANITPPTILYGDGQMNVSVKSPIIAIPYNGEDSCAFEINFSLN
ncbi:chemotaxis protein CheX [Peptococcaceae bacterium 1198_IL3148]